MRRIQSIGTLARCIELVPWRSAGRAETQRPGCTGGRAVASAPPMWTSPYPPRINSPTMRAIRGMVVFAAILVSWTGVTLAVQPASATKVCVGPDEICVVAREPCTTGYACIGAFTGDAIVVATLRPVGSAALTQSCSGSSTATLDCYYVVQALGVGAGFRCFAQGVYSAYCPYGYYQTGRPPGPWCLWLVTPAGNHNVVCT